MQTTRQLALSLVVALGLSFLPAIVVAQTSTTGTIEGTVQDTSGSAVPGVSVTATSPNLIHPQTATTNDQGVYRILNLPPGKYKVVIEPSKGFGRFEQADVEVNLSRTSTLAATLQAAGVAGSVDITSSAGATVDVTTNTSG